MSATRPTVYADASCLIALARIEQLDLLTLLPTPIYVTRTVWGEVTGGESMPGARAIREAETSGLLRVVDEGESSAYPQIDAGESSTLSAAAASGAAVMIDERKAWALVRSDPRLAAIPPPIGTVGLIVLAKQRGRIPEVRPLLDALRSETFRMSQALYEQALRTAGEWPPH